ncbi:MAG: cohesin domain-containing protein [Candidatus Bathyarchaeota archaeon]|nr:cohesin domain-containing protein [Candidatus Bathyarchaeota archaeon]
MIPIKQVSVIVLMTLLISIVSVNVLQVESAQGVAVKAEASASQPKVGDILTVTLKLSNAQDIYGLDVTLDWNPSVLKAINVTPMLGVESHPQGVLHESSTYPIEVEDNTLTSGQYHLLATSTGSSTPSFSGSGIIATIQFNVTSIGDTGLSLAAELAKRPSGGQVSLVTPSTSVDSVTVVVPEFPAVALVAFLAIAAAGTVLAASKLRRNINSTPVRF